MYVTVAEIIVAAIALRELYNLPSVQTLNAATRVTKEKDTRNGVR